ncbi:MAG: hypothetical protein GC186_14730 [Rhodobacteraceae bacterium]|nr:hypothetical protein [Paracoccaceae bacterium]
MKFKSFALATSIVALIGAASAASAQDYRVLGDAVGACPVGYALITLSTFTDASQAQLKGFDTNGDGKVCAQQVAATGTSGAGPTGNLLGGAGGVAAAGIAVAVLALALSGSTNSTTATTGTN